ncbi:tail fiber assembly protein [Xenorhabdus bovienii]|nr:tail fiber assembly protein [Xenorhabdus bovienii]MCG3461656.1 tail fiber assembly protein [Xenorhabdus bovienii]
MVTIVEIGNIPAELTLLEPKTFFDKWDGKQWVTDKIAQQAYEVQQAESQKQSRMSQATSATAIRR